jgi:hypothetical protein
MSFDPLIFATELLSSLACMQSFQFYPFLIVPVIILILAVCFDEMMFLDCPIICIIKHNLCTSSKK